MARKIIGSNWNRKSLDDHNENYKELYEKSEKIGTVNPDSVGTTELKKKSIGTEELKDGSVNRSIVDFPTEIGFISYGSIDINHVDRTVLIKKGSILSTQNSASNYTTTEDVNLTYATESAAFYLSFNRSKNAYQLTYTNNDKNNILLCMIYARRVYKAMDNTKINEYPTQTELKVSSLGFINFKNSGHDSLNVDSTSKKIKIISGACAIDNVAGYFYRNNSDLTIDFSKLNLTGNNLASLYFNKITNSYYVDITPKLSTDIKVFTLSFGKIYNAEASTQRITTVDGIANGGFGFEKAEVVESSNFYSSISEWFQAAAIKTKSTIHWLGDSTWAGYTGPKTGSTTPFPILLQAKFNEYFGDNIVTSKNLSVSGQSITYFSNRIDDLLKDSKAGDMVMIGCSLNSIGEANVKERTDNIEKIINTCFQKGLVPILVTGQAHQVPNVMQGDDWGGRTQYYTAKFDREIRYGLAKKYNLDLIDLTTFTQKLLDNTAYSIGELVSDGLHGSKIIHEFERDYIFKELVKTTINLKDTNIVSIYNQNVFSRMSLRYVKDIAKDKYGFKTQFDYSAKKDDLLMDFWVFLEPEKSTKWNIKSVIPTGSVKVEINGTSYTTNVPEFDILKNANSGLYHVKVSVNADEQVKFNGIAFELTTS